MMTPPGADVAGPSAETTAASAVFASVSPPAPSIRTLTRRADFLRAAKARRIPCPAFLLQARKRRADEDATGIRVGFTCSKKVGNAVTRNRAKRRLRALMRAVFPQGGQPDWDYVLVGRPEATITRDFALMSRDLSAALTRLHQERA